MAVIKGGDLMLFMGGSSIAFATNHSLSVSLDTKESSSKDSGGKWQVSEGGILSWTCQTENLLCDEAEGKGYDDLFTAMISRTPVTLIMAVKSETTDEVPEGGWTPKAGNGYSGKALITSLEKSASNGENATFTCSFTGVGALTPVASV